MSDSDDSDDDEGDASYDPSTPDTSAEDDDSSIGDKSEDEIVPKQSKKTKSTVRDQIQGYRKKTVSIVQISSDEEPEVVQDARWKHGQGMGAQVHEQVANQGRYGDLASLPIS